MEVAKVVEVVVDVVVTIVGVTGGEKVVVVVVMVVLGMARAPSVTWSRCFNEEASCSAEIGGLLSEMEGEIG